MTKKLQTIVNQLKANQNELYADGAFQYFIDNQIDVDELTEILKEEGIVLPEEFYKLSKPEQKRYRRHVDVTVYYDNDHEEQTARVAFNNPYFYDLAEHARKTVVYTDKLTRYVFDLVDINLIFLGMQYIKIHNCYIRRFDKLMAYADKRGINDLYELTIDLIGKPHSLPEEKQLQSLLLKYLDSDKLVGIDLLNDPNDRFFFLMEYLLSALPRKEANTLKVKFLILSKEQLRGELDYYDLDKPAKWILKDYMGKGVFSFNAIKLLKEHVKKYPELLDGMFPNGYMALYYAFLANEEEM